jgi:TatD DNase family protein
MSFIDAHCHLNAILQDLDKGVRDNIFKKFRKQGLLYLVNNVSRPANFHQAIRKKSNKSTPRILLAVGINRNLAKNKGNHPHLFTQLKGAVQDLKPDAIGEVGLDYNKQFGEIHSTNQKIFFKKEIELAREYSLPLIIHSSKADHDLLKILNATKAYEVPILIHGVDLAIPVIEQLLDLKCYFSIASRHLADGRLKKIFHSIPLNQLLIETDAPYATSLVHDSGSSSPLDVIETYNKAAEISEITLDELKRIMNSNFSKIFL